MLFRTFRVEGFESRGGEMILVKPITIKLFDQTFSRNSWSTKGSGKAINKGNAFMTIYF